MIRSVKSVLKAVLPAPLVQRLRMLPVQEQLRRARDAFERAGTEPAWLDYHLIDRYQRAYPAPPPYGYDPLSLARRGRERADSLVRMLPSTGASRFLELGCWDGMVSWALQGMGRSAVATDFVADGLDERAVRAGVTRMLLEDESFDAVFSYDGFEHFSRPADVLRESIRVLRPGGHIFFEFGPLYFSPWGAHAYRVIHVPYCPQLFRREDLERYAAEHELGRINFDQVNKYRMEEFREVWAEQAHRLKRIRYSEGRDVSHLELIERHPTCFKNKTRTFDDLILANVTVLFRKVG